MERQIPRYGEIWINTKNGEEYRIEGIAVNANNAAVGPLPRSVVYRNCKNGTLCTRDLPEFMGTRDTGSGFVYRFVYKEGQENLYPGTKEGAGV